VKSRIKQAKSRDLKMRLATDNTPTSEEYAPIDFSKVKVGIKTLTDAVIDVNPYKRINESMGDKEQVLNAIYRGDASKMRQISDFFYKTSGIYSRLCRYMAYLYRYDWVVTPYIAGGGGYDGDLSITSEINDKKRDKAVATYFNALKYIDNFEAKRMFGAIALEVVKFGCYYGYIIVNNGRISLQQLPVAYCRSRYSVNGCPAVEFNMKYFDDVYTDTEQRLKILGLFPKDFQIGYKKYKQGKLVPDFQGDQSGWYLLDINSSVKFNLSGSDYPPFISVIPAIIDLAEAQELDRKKMAQKLIKILIQKMPIDKNGDLIFDPDEAKDLHNNSVQMLQKAIGVDVLTTYADVEVADMADRNTTTTKDELEKVERSVYNEAGVSQLQFNSNGNIALNNSILNDEATMKDLLLQFQTFLNRLLMPYNTKPKELFFQADILNTTIYNYKELAKSYESQAKLGYSKLLPQIALGQSQSSVLANAYFENNILELFLVFIPPMSSNTMNTEAIQSMGHSKQADAVTDGPKEQPKDKGNDTEENTGGRPEKPDGEKSEKTIQNKESM
jgi:hypothetical protein